MKEEETRVIASNRKARHNFTIIDTLEAGIVLQGSEVKSLREGQVQIADAYAHAVRGEMWLEGVNVSLYRFSHGIGSHEPMRSRKLLLHSEQVRRLSERIAKERLTLVVLSLYLKNGRVKVELALAKGRQMQDRRQAIAAKESEIEMRRVSGRQRKGMG